MFTKELMQELWKDALDEVQRESYIDLTEDSYQIEDMGWKWYEKFGYDILRAAQPKPVKHYSKNECKVLEEKMRAEGKL